MQNPNLPALTEVPNCRDRPVNVPNFQSLKRGYNTWRNDGLGLRERLLFKLIRRVFLLLFFHNSWYESRQSYTPGNEFSGSVEEELGKLYDEEIAWSQYLLEGQGRVASAAPAQDRQYAGTGMFVMMEPPELRGRDTLSMVLKRFRTWATSNLVIRL